MWEKMVIKEEAEGADWGEADQERPASDAEAEDSCPEALGTRPLQSLNNLSERRYVVVFDH